MKARIESLGRTLLRAAEMAVRRGRVGARECGSVPRFLLTTPPPQSLSSKRIQGVHAPFLCEFCAAPETGRRDDFLFGGKICVVNV